MRKYRERRARRKSEKDTNTGRIREKERVRYKRRRTRFHDVFYNGLTNQGNNISTKARPRNYTRNYGRANLVFRILVWRVGRYMDDPLLTDQMRIVVGSLTQINL